MKITLAMITVLVALTACTTQTIALSEHEQRLQWVTAADGRQDAQKALLEGDFRLMAIGGRGIVIPGVDPQQFREYELKCGIKLVPGVTDAVQGDRHLSLLKMASRYALDYNEIILQRCNL